MAHANSFIRHDNEKSPRLSLDPPTTFFLSLSNLTQLQRSKNISLDIPLHTLTQQHSEIEHIGIQGFFQKVPKMMVRSSSTLVTLGVA
jgi:hypothetical protein